MEGLYVYMCVCLYVNMYVYKCKAVNFYAHSLQVLKNFIAVVL